MSRPFENGFSQRDCKACGGRNHKRSIQPCISADCLLALQAFAKEHGRTWRHALRLTWEQGKDEGPLREARNVIGPSRLAKVFPEQMRVNEEARTELKRKLARGES